MLQVEPLPSNLPAKILADEKWLKNDLMCIMANAAKVCHCCLSTVPITMAYLTSQSPSLSDESTILSSFF